MRLCLLLTIICATATGCGDRRPAPDRRAADPGAVSRSTPAARIGDPTGQWVVVGDSAPGTSAMDAAERRRWHGREARYAPGSVSFGADTCASPRYRTSALDADSLLATGFRLAPGALGLAPGAPVTVTEIACDGADWAAPGALLLWLGPARAYTVWDGVFFVLARRP